MVLLLALKGAPNMFIRGSKGIPLVPLMFMGLLIIATLGTSSTGSSRTACMVDVMLNPALAQYRQQLSQQSLSERSVRERYADDCLHYMWRLGKQLLRVSGVADADLEEETSGLQQQAAGEWADYRLVSSAQGVVTVELPAEVVEQLRLLWEHYSRALFHAVELYQGMLCAWVWVWGRE